MLPENTKVHKGDQLFPRLDIEKELAALDEIHKKKLEENK